MSGTQKGVYKHPRPLYTKMTQTFIYLETMCNIQKEVKNMNQITVNEMIRLGCEESDIIMCDLCNDAVAVHEARNYEVCTDCYHELGV